MDSIEGNQPADEDGVDVKLEAVAEEPVEVAVKLKAVVVKAVEEAVQLVEVVVEKRKDQPRRAGGSHPNKRKPVQVNARRRH